MDMITVDVTDTLYFHVRTPCNETWLGMRHTQDVRIVIDRALDHVMSCDRCQASDEIRQQQPAACWACSQPPECGSSTHPCVCECHPSKTEVIAHLFDHDPRDTCRACEPTLRAKTRRIGDATIDLDR